MDTEFKFIVINGRKIIARAFYLKALLAAHNELVEAHIGVAGQIGFVLGAEETSSWRPLTLQKQLVAKGLSWTLLSNHRRGSAVDCFPDLAYVEKIKPIMAKHGLVNDLGPSDRVHWNWQSNVIANTFPIIDELPGILNEYSDMDFDNHILQLTEPNVTGSGSFALVYGGQKHLVVKNRLPEATMTVLFRGMTPTAVNKAIWDSIADGQPF